MNYYERHLGDYARDTGHLSPLEHGVYTLLLDRYYATEQPIPEGQVERICRARTKDEREAVEVVLEEFFILKDGAWHNERCDREIEKFRELEPEREAKRENNRERVRRHRERRAALFSELRELGIVPDYSTGTPELEAMLKRATKRDVTQPVTRYDTANQSPDTSPQTPEEEQKNSLPTAAPSADLLGDKVTPADLAARRAQRIAQVTTDAIEAYNRILGKPNGLLASVRPGVGVETRRKQVRRCLKTAAEICQELNGDPRITADFWVAYFETAADDNFHSGRGPYAGEHENWRPDFEFLTREKTMLKLFERSVDSGMEAAA